MRQNCAYYATVAQPGTARDCYTRWLEMELFLKW